MGRPKKITVLDEDTQNTLINAIETSLNGDGKLSSQAVHMLFYWARHQDDPEFNFVPEHYKLGISSKQLRETKDSVEEPKESK